MKKDAFLRNDDVQVFIDWLRDEQQMLGMQVSLAIGNSRFVPGGLHEEVTGLVSVLDHYRWKAAGMHYGSWVETVAYLRGLSHSLRLAVDSGDNVRALQACRDILIWGGNRNWGEGAWPFLHGMDADLCHYIKEAGVAMQLDDANLEQLTPPVVRMNSMLTKVHAFYALDGLPIYDSRVASAISTLVEIWRRGLHMHENPLPAVLAFPATLPNRTVSKVFSDAQAPATLMYGAPHVAQTAELWSGAKVRLGWIMQDVLARSPALFNDRGHFPERMRAFEATLFMLGYDPRCMVQNERLH